MDKISQKKIGRLGLYRRLLHNMYSMGKTNMYSHELASIANASPAQVRRDLMVVGYTGNPSKGYDVPLLIESIANFLDAPEVQQVALVGLGHLGKAVLNFFAGRRPKLKIVVAFDNDSSKVSQNYHDCPCHHIDLLGKKLEELDIEVGVIAVPAVVAQDIADELVQAGVKGILNFAPVPLKTPDDVYVEDIDMTMSLEKVAYFSRIQPDD